MKKIIAVVLTVIMLISVSPIQSYAFTIKLPTVKSVKFLDDIAVSRKDIEYHKEQADENIEEYIEYYKEWYGEDISADDVAEFMGFESVEELYNYSLDDYGYTVEATLSDGTVHEIDVYQGHSDIDRYTTVLIWAEVKYTDYLAAVEADEDVIPVTVYCEVYSSISGIGKSSEFTLEKDFINCIVKKIAPKNTLSKTYYEDSYIPDLEGESFIVTYADGSKKTYKAEFDVEEGEYMLGGEPLWTFADEDKAYIWYYDALYEYTCTPVESPYEKIEISDYTLTEEEGLTSITLKITKKNGKTDKVVADLTDILDEDEFYPYYEGVVFYDTYIIYVYSDEIADWESKNPVVTGVELTAEMGDIYSEGVVVEYYEAPVGKKDAATVIEDVLAFILIRFFEIISLLFMDGTIN